MDDNDIFEEDFIKYIDVKKVSVNFQNLTTIGELKENKIFSNLFRNIAEDIDIENEIDCCGNEFITDYARDIYLIAKWYELLETQGKSLKQIENKIDRLVQLYITLLRYVGEYLHEIGSGDREVFEIWIIKSGITPAQIKKYWKSIDEFYKFLTLVHVNFKGYIFDEEEMNDLQRVAKEFIERAWESNKEDYSEWRQRNIKCYM